MSADIYSRKKMQFGIKLSARAELFYPQMCDEIEKDISKEKAPTEHNNKTHECQQEWRNAKRQRKKSTSMQKEKKEPKISDILKKNQYHSMSENCNIEEVVEENSRTLQKLDAPKNKDADNRKLLIAEEKDSDSMMESADVNAMLIAELNKIIKKQHEEEANKIMSQSDERSE